MSLEANQIGSLMTNQPQAVDKLVGQPSRSAPGESPDQHATRAYFLDTLYRLLEEQVVAYCRLDSDEAMTDVVPGELDLAVLPRDRAKLPGVFHGLRKAGYPAVQSVAFAVNSDRVSFACLRGANLELISVNFLFEYRHSILLLKTGTGLVAGRRKQGNSWFAAREVEFFHLLAKGCLKQTISGPQELQLQALANELGASRAEAISRELFGKRGQKAVGAACAAGNAGELLPKLKKSLFLRNIRRRPLNLIRCALGEGKRVLRQWIQPPGLFTVLLGPDGAGKSTLAVRLVESLEPVYRPNVALHWRPQVFVPRKNGGAILSGGNGSSNWLAMNRHGQPCRGPFVSVVRLFGVFLDYWLGHLAVVRPVLARSGLIISDRYIHDILVDHTRYRYGGPRWLPRLFIHLIPDPHPIFLFLDAEEAVIFQRKQEVAPEELRRQRGAYRELAHKLPDSVFIRTDHGFEKAMADTYRGVVNCLAKRFERRSGWGLSAERVMSPQRGSQGTA